jgi:hypothetical protein
VADLELLTLNLAEMKLERTNFDLPQDPPLLIAEVIGRLFSQLNKQLEDYMIEGLKRKGFDFENRIELENFIKSNCRCEDNIDFKERIYYVNDIPFFLHKYEVIQEPITEYNNGVRISANYGSYAYL